MFQMITYSSLRLHLCTFNLAPVISSTSVCCSEEILLPSTDELCGLLTHSTAADINTHRDKVLANLSHTPSGKEEVWSMEKRCHLNDICVRIEVQQEDTKHESLQSHGACLSLGPHPVLNINKWTHWGKQRYRDIYQLRSSINCR